MRMTIMILLKMMTTMMMIALVPNSICFNKVAAAEVGPRASNRTGCTFANFLTVIRMLMDYGEEGGGRW